MLRRKAPRPHTSTVSLPMRCSRPICLPSATELCPPRQTSAPDPVYKSANVHLTSFYPTISNQIFRRVAGPRPSPQRPICPLLPRERISYLISQLLPPSSDRACSSPVQFFKIRSSSESSLIQCLCLATPTRSTVCQRPETSLAFRPASS